MSVPSCRARARYWIVPTAATLLLVLAYALPGIAQSSDQPVLVVYDVSDLVRSLPDFPAPRLGLSGLDDEAQPSLRFDEEDDRPRWTTEELIDLIQSMVSPGSWENAGIEIHAEKDSIVVVHLPEHQMEVAEYLGSLERTYRIDVCLIAARDEVLGWLGFDPEGGDLQQLPGAGVRRAIARIARDHALGPETSGIVTAPGLIVCEGQRSHVSITKDSVHSTRLEPDLSGRVVRPEVESLREGVVFEATVEATPDPRRVQLRWSLREAEVGEPVPAVELGGAGEVDTPLVGHQCLESKTVLERGHALVLRFERDAMGDTPYFLVVTCTREAK